MKKLTLAILLFVYTLSSFGIGVKQFYCCGKLKTTSLSFVQGSKATCGNNNLMKGCCKTTFKTLKVRDNHIASAYIQYADKYFTSIHLSPSSLIISPLIGEPVAVAGTSHAPPVLQGVSINILHCVYRI
jgi:hypothetical protein